MTELRVRRKGTEKTLDTVADKNPLPVAVLESQTGLSVEDLLGEIAASMRIMNAHLAIITGEQLAEEDLDVVD